MNADESSSDEEDDYLGGGTTVWNRGEAPIIAGLKSKVIDGVNDNGGDGDGFEDF